MLKQKLLFAVALLVAVSMGCKKEDSVDPDKKNTENPITDTTSTDTTDNDGGNNGGINTTKLNALTINGEEIKVNSVTYGSASVFVNLASNNQDLASISIWFPLVNTGNGIQVPELGTYNVIENQTGGTPQSANQSTIHLRFISDPSYSYLYSTAGGTVEVVNDSESYRNFKVSNVNFKKMTIINLFPNSGPKGEVTLNATFSLNPFIGIERNATEATLGTWNLNGKIFTVDSEIPKPAHPSISAAGVSYISNIGRTDLRVGEVNSNISFTVQFKPNIGVVADGTYPVVNKPLGGINEGECVLVLTGNFGAPNAGNAEGFISENKGGSVTISTNASGERFVKFHNIMVTSNTSTQKYLPVSGFVKIQNAATVAVQAN